MRKLLKSRQMRLGTLAFVGALAALTGTVWASGWFAGSDNPWPYAPQGNSPVLATVGDIACQPGGPVEGSITGSPS